MNIYVSFLNIIHIDFLTLKFIILPIFCYIFALSIVTNNAFNLGIMTYLSPYRDCSCLVQLSNLSCPDSELVCSECLFNPFAWSKLLHRSYVDCSLNKSRFEFISLLDYSPFKLRL